MRQRLGFDTCGAATLLPKALAGDVITLTLRPAHPDDASSIAALCIEVWLGTYIKQGINRAFADFALSEFTADKVTDLMANPNEHFLVSQNTQGIDGVVRLSLERDAPVPDLSTFEIATLYVQPRHHGKGIGRALLNAAFERCRTLGAKTVWLATNAENSPAIAFYLSQGFDEVGTTHFTIDDQDYLNNVYAYRLD